MPGLFPSLLRTLCVALCLVFGGVTVGDSFVATAHAAKRRGKKRKGKRGRGKTKAAPPKKEIKREASFDEKAEYDLDAELAATDDLKSNIDEGNRPTLTPEALKRAETEALLTEKIDEEIKLARDLLEFQTSCEEESKVLFRLADLYWEKSKRAFFKANDFSTPQSSRAKYQTLMKKLQNSTVRHYEKIIDKCPGYSDFAKTLFYLGRVLIEVDRAADGAQYFRRIIKEYPESEWISYAWFMVGEYFFNTENDANRALKAYKKAAEYPESEMYGYAIYKQGWCYINKADWDLALERFEEVVRISDDPRTKLDNKATAALRKGALKDYVRAYSHIGDSRAAYKDFRKVGGAKAVPDMLERLGGWYVNRDAHADTITVYRMLVKNFKKSTRKPVWQGRIVNAASRLGDNRTTITQVKVLTDYFKEIRKAVSNPKLTPEQKEVVAKDLKEAEGIAENTLRRMALDFHKEAKKLKGKAEDRAYRNAYELYKHYLKVFPEPKPDADVNYVFFMRFYYAEVLYRLEEFLEAAENYDAVVDMNPNPKAKREKEIVLAAAEESVRAWDELVQDEHRKKPPKVTGRDAVPIPEKEQNLITACKRYIKYVGKEGEKIVEIRYKMARIYYTYNHFDNAAPAFNDIVANHPDNEVACYSANLALDIYYGAKDYKAVKRSSQTYLANRKLACGDEDRVRFSKLAEEATFRMVQKEEEDGRYVKAGNDYMKFYRQFPKSEFADEAVYNAAVSYDRANRLKKANEVREFLVKTFPDSDLVPETMYNIAQSFERIVDFKKAAEYLEKFHDKYPKDERSKAALYNVGVYLSTLQEFSGAKRAREKYISKYKDDDDAYKIAYSVCESLEKEAKTMERQRGRDRDVVKKWEEAHDCYFSWVKNSDYTSGHADELCHAQFRRGEIMKDKTKYARGYADQKKYLYKMWPQWKKKGADKVPRCAEAVSELKFRDLEDNFKRYRELKISELNPTKDQIFKKSVKAKTEARDKVIGKYKEIVEIGVPEWALAALFKIGQAYKNSIDRVLQAPIPNKIPGYKLTEDDKNQLRNQLKEMAAPIEDLAVEAYRICVDKANELAVYNRWSVRALDQLQKLRPEEYPLVVETMPAVSFKDPLVVVENGLVVTEGEDSFKGVDQPLKDGVGPPKEEGDEKKKKEGESEEAEPPTDAKAQPKTAAVNQ